MRLKNATDNEINAFKEAIASCKGEVWLESVEGDKFNLKSVVSQYLALAELLKEHGKDLDLYCQFREDEHYFYKFFDKYPYDT